MYFILFLIFHGFFCLVNSIENTIKTLDYSLKMPFRKYGEQFLKIRKTIVKHVQKVVFKNTCQTITKIFCLFSIPWYK